MRSTIILRVDLMKRFTSVLIAVILGAFATGIGTIPFLVLANQDRHRLDHELQSSKSLAAETEAEKRRIAMEANKKVEEANIEVQKAQSIILEAQEDERLLAVSERLVAPTTYERSKLYQIVSLYQGISLFTPKNFTVIQDEPIGFKIAKLNKQTLSTIPVMFIEPYEENSKTSWIGSFASSTEIAFAAGGKLVKGQIGSLSNGSFAMKLFVRSSAKTTHVISITDPEGTLDFYKKIISSIEYR
jgi:hypothetical protein